MKKIIYFTAALFLFSCNSQQESTGLSKVNDNLTAVASGYNPSSLNYSSRGISSITHGSNPCEGLTLFSCQPVLLKLYIALSKQMLSMTQMIVGAVKEKFDALADGAEGTGLQVEANTTIDYKKTNASKFVLLAKQSGNPSLHLDVNGSTYILTGDISVLSNGESSGKIKNTIVFTDSTHWAVTVQMAGANCDPTDTRAPRGMEITLTRKGDTWDVLAQLYFPAWLHGLTSGGQPDCLTTATFDNSMVMYTQAIGNESAAKASVYLMKTSATLSSLSSYPLSAFCENYLSSIQGVSCTAGGLATSSYPNPYCNKNGKLGAEWNNTCSAYSSTVADATLPSGFKEPAVLAATSITVPSSL